MERPVFSGLEIHATILLNLLRGDWLTADATQSRNSLNHFHWVRSRQPCFVPSACGCPAGGYYFDRNRLWRWLARLGPTNLVCLIVPATVQMPLGLAWAVGSQYVLESRRRKELRTAFGFYLSPQMADKIANSDFDLRPGGEIVEATVIFTDLENFTTLSEDLDPSEVSAILIGYFEQTTRCILEKRGTIIKYVGDAVMAAWGAPVDEPAHAICAAEAACDLGALTEIEVRGKSCAPGLASIAAKCSPAISAHRFGSITR